MNVNILFFATLLFLLVLVSCTQSKPLTSSHRLECTEENLCNQNIMVLCKRCGEHQKPLLQTVFEKQTIVFTCLENYFGYKPHGRLVYTVVGFNESCPGERCFSSGGTSQSETEVILAGVPGEYSYGETGVSAVGNVVFEIHETAHSFTASIGKQVPSWYNEGISYYADSRIPCEPSIIYYDERDPRTALERVGLENYLKLKNKEERLEEIAPYDDYDHVLHASHMIGAMFFAALEADYNCTPVCMQNLLRNIAAVNESKITPAIIQREAEQIIGQNASKLFHLLELS